MLYGVRELKKQQYRKEEMDKVVKGTKVRTDFF
jgi:hypothetical protein